MDCMIKPTNYLDLKFEDNGDHYLINSLLGFEKNDQDFFIDGLMDDHSRVLPQVQTQQFNSNPPLETHLIEEVSGYLCFRTTSLMEIIEYIEQYYPIPKQRKGSLILAIKKHKLRLKRDHAKFKATGLEQKCKPESSPIIGFEIKIEQSELSPFVYDDQSQQTRKKKRNRMSAQNSRDRKKQFIRQIQNQNRQLKKRLTLMQKQKKMSTPNREFLKMLLCLGITCYTNLHQSEEHTPITIVVEDTDEERNEASEERQSCRQSLPHQIGLLNTQQQNVIYQMLDCMGETMKNENGNLECSQHTFERSERNMGIALKKPKPQLR